MSASICEQLHSRAEQVTPGGLHHDGRMHDPQHIYIKRGKGAYLQDADDTTYLDLWMAHYDAILGHAPSFVVEAIRQAALEGIHLGTLHPMEVELAELVCQIVPNAERVRFCCTGGEATAYALRLARAYTGRSVVIKMAGGWHGATSETLLDSLVKSPEEHGVEGLGLSPDTSKYLLSAQFNDPASVVSAIKEAGNNLAAILLEPVLGAAGMLPAEPSFLHFLKEETQRSKALLIFDEVITGFRLGLGGAQSFYQIKPDLATFGKVMGGGMGIGAITGSAEILEFGNPKKPCAERALIGGGTYSCNPLSLVSGLTTLKHLQQKEQDIYPQLAENNRFLREELQAIFQKHNIPFVTTGEASLGSVQFLKQHGMSVRNTEEITQNTLPQVKTLFCQHMRKQQIFYMGNYALSTTHQKKELARILEVAASFRPPPA